MISIIICVVCGLFLGSVNAEALSQLAVVRPSYGETINVGVPYTLKWIPGATSVRVNLVLRSGSPNNLATEYVIANNITNTGEYVWSAPFYTHKNYPLSLMVEDTTNSSIVNYSPFFVVLDSGLYLPSGEFNLLIHQTNEMSARKEMQVDYASSITALPSLSSSSKSKPQPTSISQIIPKWPSFKRSSEIPTVVSKSASHAMNYTTKYVGDTLLKSKESPTRAVPFTSSASASSSPSPSPSFAFRKKQNTTSMSYLSSKKPDVTPSSRQRTFRVLLEEIDASSHGQYEGIATLPIDKLDEAIPSYISEIGHHDGRRGTSQTSSSISSTSVGLSEGSLISLKGLETKNAALGKFIPSKLVYFLFYLI